MAGNLMAEDRCSACRAPVRPVITEQGRHRDLDPGPVDGGNVIIVEVAGNIRARVLTGSSGGPDGAETFRMHQCPPPPPPGPACDSCRLPMMPREFAIRTKQERHAACEPDHLEQLQVEARQEAARRARARRGRK